jgi:peptidoglycan/xylan/chitin deacetylase (PgdA/CDA1 family)
MQQANIPILMYHQVDASPPKNAPMRGLVVTPQRFAAHMRLLRLLGFQGLSMRNLEPYLRGEKTGRVVGITFDDGYYNNLSNALPILRHYGFTATCYVVTQSFGGQNTWDKDAGVAQKPLMTVEHARSWLEAGQELGSHTRTHADLSTATAMQCADEIAGSKEDLDKLFGPGTARHFCYPYGRFSADCARAVAQSGYHSATTTQRGRACAPDPLLQLPRVLVSRTTSSLALGLKLLTGYEDRRRRKA